MISIGINDLGKAYWIYSKPVDSLKEWIFRRSYHETFWAVRDLTFSIPRGGSLGVVGENGAGKTTLLQLLVGTIEPTTGTIHRYGRVAAILELGSGFHPDLTGRENAKLGCAVLGLSPEETRDRIPEIIAFSELDNFIDRPVKTYSSGMYMRLAFSVATSVDPDILIVDEALSVGDQHFQKKSMDRMMAFREAGKTLVFCSHALYFVRQVCEHCVWLRHGRAEMLGPVDQVTESYQDYQRAQDAGVESTSSDGKPPASLSLKPATSDSYIEDVSLAGDCKDEAIESGKTLIVRITAHVDLSDRGDIHFGLLFQRNDLVDCYGVSTEMADIPLRPLPNGNYGVSFIVDSLALLAGVYTVDAILLDRRGMHIYDHRKAAVQFRVYQSSQEVGVARLDHRWEQL